MALGQIHLSDAEAAWLAAAIDGEGSITFFIKRDKQSGKPVIEPHVSIYNNSVPFLNYAKKIIGFGNVYCKENRASEYRLNSQNLCYQILTQTFPFLIIKRLQARKVMQFCERNGGTYTLKDLHIYEAVKRANYKHNAPLLQNDLYNELKMQLESGGDYI